jgi:uncharacterized membrane protein YoaT (DUF817 family)
VHKPPPDTPQKSAATAFAPLARFIETEAAVGQWAARGGRLRAWGYEFLRFGIKQAWACLFGGLMVALIIATTLLYPRGSALARYDFLFLAALGIQIAMLAFRLETWKEAKVIFIFHVVGTIMEVFKTGVGSWIYPEAGFFKIGGVPLFSGFMYASIGSYIARVWHLFDFRFRNHPPLWAVYLLAGAIYLNFYAHHYIYDFRYFLFAAAVLLFGRTIIDYKPWHVHRPMPLLLAAFLVALFVWIAENVGTITKTWLYPHQLTGWQAVSLAKFGSWFLLLFLSYALVAFVNRPGSEKK